MLLIRNNAVLTTPVAFTTAATKIPFDTAVYKTNANLQLDDSSVAIKTTGVYESECSVTVGNTSSSATATVTLQAYADGVAITGASATATVAASSKIAITLPWAVKIISAESGTAKIAWYLSGGAVNLENAIVRVAKVV